MTTEYECNACLIRTCTLSIRGTDGTPSICPINGHTPTWRLQRPDDNRPLIVWEDTDDPAIRQLQEYFERAVNHG